jgi:hypothetical protein
MFALLRCGFVGYARHRRSFTAVLMHDIFAPFADTLQVLGSKRYGFTAHRARRVEYFHFRLFSEDMLSFGYWKALRPAVSETDQWTSAKEHLVMCPS